MAARVAWPKQAVQTASAMRKAAETADRERENAQQLQQCGGSSSRQSMEKKEQVTGRRQHQHQQQLERLEHCRCKAFTSASASGGTVCRHAQPHAQLPQRRPGIGTLPPGKLRRTVAHLARKMSAAPIRGIAERSPHTHTQTTVGG